MSGDDKIFLEYATLNNLWFCGLFIVFCLQRVCMSGHHGITRCGKFFSTWLKVEVNICLQDFPETLSCTDRCQWHIPKACHLSGTSCWRPTEHISLSHTHTYTQNLLEALRHLILIILDKEHHLEVLSDIQQPPKALKIEASILQASVSTSLWF